MHRIDTLIHSIVAVSDENLPTTVSAVRQCINRAFCSSLPMDKVWLVGTDGCHLCDDAQMQYELLAKRQSLPDVCVLDVVNFDNELMAILAPCIPVLIGFDRLLVYPFGLLDIHTLATGGAG